MIASFQPAAVRARVTRLAVSLCNCAASQAPVIFSHSGARAIGDHPRNVPDDVLRQVAKNRGVVMADFATGYVSEARRLWNGDQAGEAAREASLLVGQPEKRKAAMAAWVAAHPMPRVTLAQVADHIEHIRKVASIDNIGIGSDFDGIPTSPDGLSGVDNYPDLFVELARRGWSDQDLAKLAGGNILRALREAEKVSARLRASRPASEGLIEVMDAPARSGG